MDFQMDAPVECTDGRVGKVSRLMVDPTTRMLMYVVVRESGMAGLERMVPIEYVVDSNDDLMRLKISRAEFGGLNSADIYQTIDPEGAISDNRGGSIVSWQYGSVYMPADPIAIAKEQHPSGAVVVRRKDRVEATDGRAGQVDELVIDPETRVVTHLVMRENHLFKHTEIIIPLDKIDHVDDGVVYLKLSKAEIDAME